VTAVTEWDVGTLDRLVTLCRLALPDENLTPDELRACCFDDGIVFGTSGGDGAVSVCTRDVGDQRTAYLKLLVVAPEAQRHGIGRKLLDAATGWAGETGAREFLLGPSAPFYLWPGIDVTMTAMLTLAESAGFHVRGDALNMSSSTSFRSAPPASVDVCSVTSAAQADALVELASVHWPNWVAELSRAVEHGTCIGAWERDHALAFACHSVNRAGWVGPIATDPRQQGRGIGAALMGELCRDLDSRGLDTAEIAWVGPIGFYAKAMGATVSRSFRVYGCRL
jgi:GNAT superfamily N-acetyltransferase